MTHPLNAIRVRQPSFLLLYSPLQFAPGEIAKPDGSLSLAYVAGALRRAEYEVAILDCAVGGDDDQLKDTFFQCTALPSGLFRVGMNWERIVEAVNKFDVIGISSIFTPQTSMVLAVLRLVKLIAPDKLLIAGGVNARSLRKRFFDSGVDVIAISEAEETIVQIAEAVQGKRALTEVPGIAFRDELGREILNPLGTVKADLDSLPLPAWDLLPLQKYWEISRPHGGVFSEGARIRYASIQTSRGCPFRCEYCHISMEKLGSASGAVGIFRVKSIDRVIQELEILKRLGVEYVFLEDDSLFAKKARAYELFSLVRNMGLQLLDVNGINICHLQKKQGGVLRTDDEFLQVLAQAGLRFLSLPFESANQRLLDKYSTSKWNISHTDVRGMLRSIEVAGIKASGNFMIGYPDETLSEIHSTIDMAKRCVDEGILYALFFNVVPYPGSALYETVLANGQLDPEFDVDQMRWTKSILRNLAVPADRLEHIRQNAWLTVNRREYAEYKYGMVVKGQSAG